MILNIKGVRLYWSKSNIRYTSMGLHHTRDQHIAAEVLGGGNPFIRAPRPGQRNEGHMDWSAAVDVQLADEDVMQISGAGHIF